MSKIFDMKQERAKLTNSIRALMDKHEDIEMSAEDMGILNKLEADFDKLNDRITKEEKQLERERAAGEIEDTMEKRGEKETTNLFAKALGGNSKHMQEYKDSMSLGDDAQAGSLTAPMVFVQQLIKELNDFMFMRSLSNLIGPIGAGQSLGFPFRKTEANDAEWTSEVARAAEETDLEYGRREFKPNRLTKRILLSNTLMQHAPMAERTIMDEMLYRVATAQENAYITGDGVNKPLGVFTASSFGIDTDRDISEGNTDTEITVDGLIAAKYSLKEQYLRGASWLMHRYAVKMLAKLKDSNGQYIWQPSVREGAPDTMLGHNVNMSEFAPNTFTSGKYAATFGNFRLGYWIVDADSIRLQVLRELYAENNQIGYLFSYFGDGAPVLGEAFARVKLA